MSSAPSGPAASPSPGSPSSEPASSSDPAQSPLPGWAGGPPIEGALLVVAVGAVSLSAPLISATAAPALAVAFWRNAMAVGALTPVALLRHRRELRGMGRRAVLLSLAAGVLLAVHFGLWLPSLRMTSVASSTAVVSTTPIWTTLLLRLSGRRPPTLVWVGTATAFLGVLILTGVDLSLSSRALTGDALALGGGVAAAGYVLLGAEVRRSVSTVGYTLVCYATTAVLLLAVCLLAGQATFGYSATTWGQLALLTATAQLLGHSLMNRVVRSLGPSVTSTAVLLESPGAALIAAFWLGERPPFGAYPALAVILLGLVMAVRAGRRPGAAQGAEATSGPLPPPSPSG